MKILRGCTRFEYQVDRNMFWQLIWQAVCTLVHGSITVRVTLTDGNMPTYPDYASLEQLNTDGDNHVRS